MDVTFNFILLMSAGIAFIIAMLVWLKYKMPGSIVGGFLLDLGCVWSLAYLIQIISRDPLDVAFWYSIQTALSFLVPAFFFVYMARYFEADEKVFKKMVYFIAPSLLFAGLAVTNGWHTLMWSNLAITPNNQVTVDYGIFGLLAILHLFVLVISATYLFVNMIMSKKEIYKIRALTFLVAIAIFATTYGLSSCLFLRP